MSLAECLVIAVIALCVIKPDDWPRVINTVARGIKTIKHLINEFQQHADHLIDEVSLPDRERQATDIDKSYHSE